MTNLCISMILYHEVKRSYRSSAKRVVTLENNLRDNGRVAFAEIDEVAVWSFVTTTGGHPCKRTHVILKKMVSLGVILSAEISCRMRM